MHSRYTFADARKSFSIEKSSDENAETRNRNQTKFSRLQNREQFKIGAVELIIKGGNICFPWKSKKKN